MENKPNQTSASRRTALKTLSVLGFTGGLGKSAIDMATANSENVVSKSELPENAKKRIEEVLGKGEAIGLHSKLPAKLLKADAVIVDGKQVPIEVRSKRKGPYGISPTRTSESDVPEAKLVSVRKTGWGKFLFQKALNKGMVETGMEMPEPFLNNQYAEYDDAIYELNQIALGPPVAMISLRR
jgi:hypothetical protein